jgi:nicotinamidase-related amidase
VNQAGKQETRWALVLIDLQRDLCLDPKRSELVAAALPNILELADRFHAKGLPIIYTKFELDEGDPQFDRFGDRYCIAGTDGANLIDEVYPLLGTVVVKKKHSAFFETELDDILAKTGSNGVVLCGLQTQICILTTAADAHHRGLGVLAASDGVISTRDEVRLHALEWIEKYVGSVRTSREIGAML